MAEDLGWQKLSDLVDKADPSVKKRLGQIEALSRWADIVGEELAAHTRPLKLSPELLTVAVPSTVWAHELTMRKLEIIAKIKPYLGEIDVRFVVG
ncbi:MAG: DUF721 domain-containing protein [Proteobacteria bacterium]|nr:DUF721 domain-containing protein [Pseudomonadota bacterium]